MSFGVNLALSGSMHHAGAFYVVMAIVGVVLVVTFVVGLIVLVLRNINREWPIR